MALSRGNAALISLLVPGLPQLLLGRPIRGVVAFVLTVGAFWAGFSILHERLWFLQAVPGTGITRYFPVLLLPEFANVGATVLAATLREADTPELARQMLLPRPGEHLGMMLTGFSGILAALFASDAFCIAGRRPAPRIAPSWAAGLSWMVPGLGHVLAGQRSKGFLLGAAVLSMFGFGLLVAEGHAVDRAAYPLWWAGQAFCGIGAVFTTLVTAPLQMQADVASLDLGIVLCTVAGLMNMMVMTDAFAVAERGPEPVGKGAG
jgi:TM2 domain-containing membrane protein YozV